ncbi:MAG: Ig-like domain-containing protein, partial [Mucilaginibacter sp.]|nr:Ig-like domain-containing protein [Mucilaginibacter sp.]
MKQKITPTFESTQVRKSRGYSKTFTAIWSMVLLLMLFIAGCKKDEFKAVQGVCPLVTTDPMDKAVDVILPKVITATFNTDMDAATITKTTFIIKQGANAVSGTVAPTGNARVYTFTPDVPLLPFVVYTGTITTGAADKFHTALVNDNVWTFTTIPQISLSVLPVASGTTTGAGTFAQGSTA